MKKILVLLLTMCIVMLTACGTPSPSDVLKADLENAKSSPDEIVSEIGDTGFGEEAMSELVQKVLAFEYELGEETIDGETATVETTITTYPFGEIFTTVVTNFITQAFTNAGDLSDEDMAGLIDQLLIEELGKAEKTYKETVSIQLKLEDGNWVVQETKEMSNALTGGMYPAPRLLAQWDCTKS